METEIQRIGHNIDLKGIVIHQVSKDAGTNTSKLHLSTKQLPITAKEKLFIANVSKSYYKKSNPIYGIFGDEEEVFKKELKKYHTEKTNFFDFSKISASHYNKIIQDKTAATGGMLIFAHYINKDNYTEYLIVLTTNNKDGYAIDETTLTITDIKNLDLSKIDVACLINLTKWDKISQGLDTTSKTYLSFVKGNKEVSRYFMTFIDCQDKSTSSESTKRLILSIDKYCTTKGYNSDETKRKKNDIFDYCIDCLDKKKEISLEAISILFDNENPYEFSEFASNEDNRVSAIISGEKSLLRRIKYVFYKDKNITVGFDNNLLGKSILYDKKTKALTFKELPAKLIQELDR